ncbi:unnamed protein product [Adineta steineri]|uniref:Uncharacterized protein n=1 Tax=Adineta steineri TaxID=433720 RepID=A0A819EGR2_9BILA|nr:unnamed protein product [Adineta steineri]CAF0839221.1 unnamed protein product [Adineta steineri]CAF1100590.1 unnamed protein product [Adineta steineri]CAF3850676.1 unnamed protein product [Adineta steineri]CAF4022383.1 unnamed protein product [Adineta steineri]
MFGLAKSLDFSDTTAVNNAIANVCNAISTRPGPAAAIIDRMQTALNERQQQIQQRLPQTFTYITNQQNKDKLKAGGDNCKNYFNGLRTPLMIDLQNNKEMLQFMQQVFEQRMNDFINEIQQQSG